MRGIVAKHKNRRFSLVLLFFLRTGAFFENCHECSVVRRKKRLKGIDYN